MSSWKARVAGPLAFVVILWAWPGPAGKTAACVAWMAAWWVTEAVPLAVTSLLPLVLFPVMGLVSVKEVAPRYGNHMIFLFLGGFVLALAVEKSGLARRLALCALKAAGSSSRAQLGAFLVVTAMLSMWLSNTATTIMMLALAKGVAERLPQRVARSRLMLAVAYGASIGGLGTLVGTPPNALLAGMVGELVPGLSAPGFAQWMAFGIPLVLLLLPVAYLLLSRGLSSESVEPSGEVVKELSRLGPLSAKEKLAAGLFVVTALAWITRGGFRFGEVSIGGWAKLLPEPGYVSDAVVAVAAAVAAVLVGLLNWDEIRHGVPWGVLLLFGGGFALAHGVRTSGLDRVVAGKLTVLGGLPAVFVVLPVCLVAMLATELTSNTATASLLLPVVAGLAEAASVPPMLVMVAATVSCSCAFMLPVATPPNAIVIGSGLVGAKELFREGVRLNLISAVIITLLTLTLGRLVFMG